MASHTLEHALLDVQPDRTAEFEAAFAAARPLIEMQPGFDSLQLLRCVEYSARYLLLVEWESVAAHTEGFRSSPQYTQWRALLHHFYDPMPEVTHFAQV